MGWPLAPRAATLLGRSHGVTARVTASVNGSDFVLPVALTPGGTVGVDGKSPARRTLGCTLQAAITDPEVDPTSAELRVEYGMQDPASGTIYWTPVGTFVITDAEEAGLGLVTIKGVDRWQRVVDARFEQPRTTSGNTVTAITNLLTEADSRITVVVDVGLSGTHLTSLWDVDRGEAITKLARSIGAIVYFRPDGVARIARVPSLGDTSYWQIGRGPGGAKSSSRRGVTRSKTYNAFAVTGQPGGDLPPVYAVARDNDPASKTRYGGPFGKRPRRYTTSLITTQLQAQAAADAGLAQWLGVARTLSVAAPPNPGLDAGDVITAEVAPDEWQRHITESFTLPLGLGTVGIATRSNVVEDDDGSS